MMSSSCLPPAALVLEPAMVNDIDGIMEVERGCFSAVWTREQYAHQITRPDRHGYVVARWDGRIVGFAAIYTDGLEGHISTLGVLPHFRQRGIGRALLRYLLTWARQQGLESVSLEVRASNTIAQHLYHEHGFFLLGHRRRYYTDNGEDALIMVREGIQEETECVIRDP